jgi:NAD(P)-dependent dehydrogenase (short-subunit alcohol dehydrogenase family)
MTGLSGQTVLITGASRGIGAAAAREFAENEANVVLFARDKGSIHAIADETGQQALAITGDISVFSDVQRAIETTVKTFGKLDVLINNAAALEPISHQADADPEVWGKLIDINIKGVFYANRCTLPIMIKNGGGTIITISSGAAHNPIEAWSAYCTSKAGAAMLTSCTDHEYRHQGIRAMGLSPGTVATQMQRDIKASGINPVSQLDWSDHIPPEWPAKTLVWMCGSDADKFMGKEISLRENYILKAVGLK